MNNKYDEVIELVKSAEKFVFSTELCKDVSMKGDADFVTLVDISISNYLKNELKKIYPDAGFFSEEESGKLTDVCWILDPIDGTTNLVYGYNMSSISLALYKNGKIVFGVVYNPFTKECFHSIIGEGAYLNKEKISVSSRELKDSLIEFGAGSTRKSEAEKTFKIAKEVFCNCVDLRRICSSALDICYIAAGRIDGYFESRLKPWDYAAASLILQEAGGSISTYDNCEVSMAQPSSVIASNGIVGEDLRNIINKY